MAAGAPEELLRAVRSALAAAGDPERAEGQQRYMKSAQPYHGLTAPCSGRPCARSWATRHTG